MIFHHMLIRKLLPHSGMNLVRNRSWNCVSKITVWYLPLIFEFNISKKNHQLKQKNYTKSYNKPLILVDQGKGLVIRGWELLDKMVLSAFHFSSLEYTFYLASCISRHFIINWTKTGYIDCIHNFNCTHNFSLTFDSYFQLKFYSFLSEDMLQIKSLCYQ